MKLPAASSGVSPGDIILFAASGGEFDPERLNFDLPVIAADNVASPWCYSCEILFPAYVMVNYLSLNHCEDLPNKLIPIYPRTVNTSSLSHILHL